MIRIMISLAKDDKTWLERHAKEEDVSMAEVVRRAIKRFRSESCCEPLTTQELLARTAGIRLGEDGLALQKRLREELVGNREEEPKAVLLDMPEVGDDADFERNPDRPHRLDL